MNQPMVSVVMSVYNAEKYLGAAIDSVLNQSFSNFEFIIIEDCSTDKSFEILKQYAARDCRIKLIQKSGNRRMKGFIENLNIGLTEAQGKYIARMDADDISNPERFRKQVNFLESNPDIFMVGSSINFIDEKGSFIKKHDALESDSEIKNKMPIRIAMYHPVIMFRNKQGVTYRDKIFYCEDYDLYLRLMIEGKKFHNFTESLLDYRLLDSSISRKDGNFFRTLFVEKMKSFYFEKKKKGFDSYESFIPENLLNIMNNEIESSEKDLIFALSVATKYRYQKEFEILFKKVSNQNRNFYLLKTLNSLPAIFSKIYFKFKEKI